MGTKVQLKSYLPEFCTMRDLNEDADSSWSHHYENREMGRQLYGHDQQAGQSNRYSGWDRESIKRTIIEQNATFRNQVYELHHVYNKQKELMDEFKRKGSYGYLQADTSLSNSYTSQVPSDGANKMRHALHLPATNTSYNRAPVTLNNDIMSPLNILRGSSMQSGPLLIGKGATLKDDDTNKRCSRRTFDLQLPPDVYIDCEDAEKSEKEIFAGSSSVNTFSLNSIQAAPENHVKFSLRTSDSFSYRGGNWRSDLCTQNGMASRRFADLNEPIASVSYNFLGQRTTLEENQGHQLPTRSKASFPNLQSAFFSGRHMEEGTYPNLFHATKEISQERQFFNDNPGQTTSTRTLFSPVSSKQNLSISSAVPQLKLKQPLEFFSPDQNKKDIWYQQKQGHGIDFSGRYAHCERTAPSMPNSLSARPSCDYTNTASSFFSSWTNPPNGCSYSPLAANCPSDKWRSNGDLKSYPILGAGSSSHQNGNFRVDYGSASQLPRFGSPNLNRRIKDVNLNQVPLIGNEDCHVTQNNTVMSDSKVKRDNSPGFLPWLKKPAGIFSSHVELDFSQDYPKLRAQETEKTRPMLDLQDCPSASQVHKHESSDGLSRSRLFGFTIFDKTKQDPELSASRQKSPETSGTKCSAKDLEIKDHVGGLITSSVRNHINLNSDPCSLEIPDEDEIVAAPSRVLASNVAPLIDLEALPYEALANEAADNILWMSLNRDSHLDGILRNPLPHGLFDNLLLFAEIVSSNSTKAKERSDDVLDMFEQTTLELEEIKPEEFWCRPWKEEVEKNDDDDRKNIADSLLFTKARRGQGRKRRQKRDFQTDILPGLVSLSRQEVTEDLQTISGMMKASGQTWQYGVARRNMSRNARNSRARGRVPRSSTINEAETWMSPPPPPPPVSAGPLLTNNIEVDGANIVGWGRTTRRCQRQRCPPVTHVAASIT